MKPLCLLYFGADASWKRLEKSGFSRRNTNLLKAFSEHPEVGLVVNVQFYTRSQWIQSWWPGQKSAPSTSPKVNDFGAIAFFPSLLPGAKHLNLLLNRLRFKRLIGNRNVQVVSWCYWPQGYSEWKRFWNRGLMVFDADHNIAEDPHLPDDKRSRQQSLLRAVGNDAHAIVSSSRTMNRWFDRDHKVHLLMNGVDGARFNHLSQSTSPNPPVIGYLGSLSKWMEIQWIKQLAAAHPEWRFRIGGVDHQTNASEELSGLENVELCGRIPFDDVPAFIDALSVGLSLYKPHPAVDVNSMKVYEYLAGHRPVVALENHPDVSADFNGVLHTITSFDEFEAAIAALIESPPSQEWEAKVDQFLEANQWSNRADEAMDIIESIIPAAS